MNRLGTVARREKAAYFRRSRVGDARRGTLNRRRRHILRIRRARGSSLDRRKYGVERATLLVAVVALTISAYTSFRQLQLGQDQSEIGHRQAEISVAQSQLSKQGLDIAKTQNGIAQSSIDATRFQSVYERLLDVDRLVADKPKLAGVVDEGDTDTAAEIYVLDFNQYVWDNVRRLINPNSELPVDFALRHPIDGSTIPSPPDGWSVDQWEAWTTWSETIMGTFRGSDDSEQTSGGPLCAVLNRFRDGYGQDLVNAVVRTKVCLPTVLPPSD